MHLLARLVWQAWHHREKEIQKGTTMKMQLSLVMLLLVVGALVACQPQAEDSALLEQRVAAVEARLDQQPPPPDLGGLEMRVATLEQLQAAQAQAPEQEPVAGDDEVEQLEARIEALEAMMAEAPPASAQEETVEATEEEEQAADDLLFQVVVATYHLDTAGLHDMDVAINETGQIEPYYAGTVRRVHRVLAVTTWPPELQEEVAAFQESLEAFATALADNDVETAAPLATQVHDEQHALSHLVDNWIAQHGIGDGEGHDH
jgi:hypothetical protein